MAIKSKTTMEQSQYNNTSFRTRRLKYSSTTNRPRRLLRGASKADVPILGINTWNQIK